MATNLPTDIAGSYPDRSQGDRAHQQHHDTVHGAVNELTQTVETGRLSEGALSATFAAPIRSNVVGIIGDSIAAGTTGGSWTRHLQARSNGRFVLAVNAGIGGNNSNQMLARIQADLIVHKPQWCVIEGVTPNDASQGVSAATEQANIIAMVDAVRKAGLRPIVTLGPPSDTTAYRDYMQSQNAWLVRWAEQNGIPAWDLNTAVADPADGTFQASMTVDGTHFSGAGAQAVAQYIVDNDLLPGDMRRTPRLLTSITDPTNLLGNGVFVGDANADGMADGWTAISGLATRSLEARVGGLGNWQVVTAEGGVEYFASNTFASGFSVGDMIEVTGEFMATAGAPKIIIRPTYNTSTGLGVDYNWDPTDGLTPSGVAVPFVRRFTVPAGATNLALRVIITAAGTAKFGRFAYRNLTALGVA